jgi:hypothetical protein
MKMVFGWKPSLGLNRSLDGPGGAAVEQFFPGASAFFGFGIFDLAVD